MAAKKLERRIILWSVGILSAMLSYSIRFRPVIERRNKNEQFNPRRCVSMTTIGGMNSDNGSASHFQARSFKRFSSLVTNAYTHSWRQRLNLTFLSSLAVFVFHTITSLYLLPALRSLKGLHEAKKIYLFIKIHRL